MTKAIPIETLQQMFENISRSTKWDLKKPLLWGYFFMHNQPKPLEQAKTTLIEKGYRFVDIVICDKTSPKDQDKWRLHVEKEEIHTPRTLDKRNEELTKFAKDFGLDSYDGMDVGPIVNRP